jgi:preprotein translocase subunit SecY
MPKSKLTQKIKTRKKIYANKPKICKMEIRAFCSEPIFLFFLFFSKVYFRIFWTKLLKNPQNTFKIFKKKKKK